MGWLRQRAWFLAGIIGLSVLGVAAVVVGGAALSSAPAAQRATQTAWPTIKPAGDPPVAVFIGDSYTAGVGASEPAKRWTALVSASEGWQEVNLGRGGTGYLTTAGTAGCGRTTCPNYQGMLSQAVARGPDVVVVAGGQNDQLQDPDREAAAIGAFFTKLRQGLPSAKIVAVGPSSPDADPGEHIKQVNAEVGEAAAAAGATYVDLLDPPAVTPGMLLANKTQVGDAGYAAIAARVEAALK